MMKTLIKYYPPGLSPTQQDITGHELLIALFWDKWDDFGTKTRFPCHIYINGHKIDFLTGIKILISNTNFSGNYLSNKINSGWNGEFPIPGEIYISVPEDIEFYSILEKNIGIKKLSTILTILKDAGYTSNIIKDPSTIELITSAEFESSLLRESGSYKAYVDGWRIFHTEKKSQISSFSFRPLDINSKNNLEIKFSFDESLLPSDINIIIGPNGIGKSFILKCLTECLLGIESGSKESREKYNYVPFNTRPNADKIILVSYSPFEEFALDLEDTSLQNKDAYKYFGFRQRREKTGNITISRSLPAVNAVESILHCLNEDQQSELLGRNIKKFPTIINILKEAIDFDSVGIVCKLSESDTSEILINIDENTNPLDISKLEGSVIHQKGVQFVKNKQPITLSSGQRLFSFIVMNVVGSLRQNSIIIIDEPELFLHPNLEISFIKLLKSVLKAFNSKAILATHSLVTAREVPSACVHVIRNSEYGKEATNPPIETFGGNVQTISTYVFGDSSVSKPYEEWIINMLEQHGDSETLLNKLGDNANIEMALKIKHIERFKNGSNSN